MSETAIGPKDLEIAFAAFSEKSGRLEESYRALQDRVDALSARLREAQSERHRELLEKERLSNRLARLLETLPGAFLVIDGDGVIIERNSRASELLNRPLLGVCWADVVQREFCPNRRVDGDLCLRDGRWINLFRRPLDYEHGEILLLTDVTESRRMTEALQSHERLSAMGEMTASLAHQIRTPLSSALLYLSQLETELPETSRPLAERARLCLNNLDGLVNDMLSYVSGAEPECETIQVAELLRNALAAIEPQLSDASYVTIELQDASLTVSGNREALLGALLNLMENALQACGRQAIIELSAFRNGDEVCLVVADNGHGVPKDARDKLFQPFYTTRPQGTGLGLAIVRSVAEIHGGDVELYSSDEGSTFAICLPMDARPAALPSGLSTDSKPANGLPEIGHA